MAASVVYSSIFGAAMASLPAVKTHLVVFDTAVVDMTEQLNDPVDLLFGVQLGGGTDINRAVGYCQSLIRDPQRRCEPVGGAARHRNLTRKKLIGLTLPETVLRQDFYAPDKSARTLITTFLISAGSVTTQPGLCGSPGIKTANMPGLRVTDCSLAISPHS